MVILFHLFFCLVGFNIPLRFKFWANKPSVKIFVLIFYFVCMNILSICLSVYHMHAWHLWKPEEKVGFLGTEIAEDCELPCRCWE